MLNAVVANLVKIKTNNMKELIEKQKSIIAEIDAIKKRFMPHGYCVDLEALEGVAIGAGGKDLSPKDLIDLFFKSGILVSRGTTAITKIDDLAQFQLNVLYNQLQEVCEQIQNEYIAKSEQV